MRNAKSARLLCLVLCLMLLLTNDLHLSDRSALAWSNYKYFPETDHTVLGIFLDYWEENGGLRQQGYPISEQIQEVSDVDGKSYSVQYFERAEFEYHPELQSTNKVLLSLLGSLRYAQKYPGGAPNQKPNQSPGSLFSQTGKRLGGSFLAYWQQYGGLAQQGYPISDEIQERSETDGQIYTVQYFERSVMEWHPGNTPPNDVLLSLLGTFHYNDKYSEAIQSLGTPRIISTAVVWEVAAGGHYIFYLRDDNPDPSPYDAIKALYGYDLTQNKEFFIKHTANELPNMATDGQYLVWSEYARGASDQNPQPVYSYDVVTGRTTRIMTATMFIDIGSSGMSLDGGILYYHDSTPTHKGLYARNLVTSQEQLISEDGYGPVASDGKVLWQTFRDDNTPLGSHSLHLTNMENIRADTVITETTSTFGGYDISGSNIVWSFLSYYVPLDVYLYRLDDKSTTLLGVPGRQPHINVNKVVWTAGDLGKFFSNKNPSIVSYDLQSLISLTAVQGNSNEPVAVDVIDNNVLVYSVISEKLGEKGFRDLFIRTLGCPCNP